MTTTSKTEPDGVYLTVTYCDEHGGHADAYRTLTGARRAMRGWRKERIDNDLGYGVERETRSQCAARIFEVDEPNEIVCAEMAIRLEVDLKGRPVRVPLGD